MSSNTDQVIGSANLNSCYQAANNGVAGFTIEGCNSAHSSVKSLSGDYKMAAAVAAAADDWVSIPTSLPGAFCDNAKNIIKKNTPARAGIMLHVLAWGSQLYNAINAEHRSRGEPVTFTDKVAEACEIPH